MLNAHVVADRVGVREVTSALSHGAHGAVSWVMGLQVAASLRQRRECGATQRALEPAPLQVF